MTTRGGGRHGLRALVSNRPADAARRPPAGPLGLRGDRLYALLRWLRPWRMFQDSATTWADRYPPIFAFVKGQLGDHDALQLASFGCSTGEEAFTLRRYFPSARIVGIDINPSCIAAARGRPEARADPRIRFASGGSLRRAPGGPFDAIFCLSVLRRGALGVGVRERCDPLLRFASFERQVGEFAARLRPGGLLALYNCNFRLRDCAAAASFDVALSVPLGPDPETPLFGPDNRRLADQSHGDIVFRRR